MQHWRGKYVFPPAVIFGTIGKKIETSHFIWVRGDNIQHRLCQRTEDRHAWMDSENENHNAVLMDFFCTVIAWAGNCTARKNIIDIIDIPTSRGEWYKLSDGPNSLGGIMH